MANAARALPSLETAKRACRCRLCGENIAKGEKRLVSQIPDTSEKYGRRDALIESFQHPACTQRACFFERSSGATSHRVCRVKETAFVKGSLRFAVPCNKGFTNPKDRSFYTCKTFHDFSIDAVSPAVSPRSILGPGGDTTLELSDIKGFTVLTPQEREQILASLRVDDARVVHSKGGGEVEVEDDSVSGSGDESGGGSMLNNNDVDDDDDDDGVHVPGEEASGGDNNNKKTRKVC